jgi:hypothetical protein
MADLLALKTNQALLKQLERAITHKPSSAEILEQRVSFVVGLLKPDSGVTREHVRKVIVDQDGGNGGVGK